MRYTDMLLRAKLFWTQSWKPNLVEEGDLEDKINSSQSKILLLWCRKLPGTGITPHESLCPQRERETLGAGITVPGLCLLISMEKL